VSDVDHQINQRIFETSLDLILVVDSHGTLIRVSPSSMAILGYDPAEMAGRSARGFLYHEDLDSTRREMRQARYTSMMRNFECRYVHKSGHVVTLWWAGVWSAPEHQYFFIGRDMTEQRRSEERVRQAQKMEAIGNLTGGMAHDFNNVLGVIIGNLDLARTLIDENGAVSELLGDATAAAVSAAEMTRRLLAFARQQPLRPQRIDVNAQVAGIVRLLRRTLGEDIEIALDLAADLWPVVADAAQLEAAITNLATNARDAMPNGGKLSVTTTNRELDADYAAAHIEVAPGAYTAIEVTDTGSGMSSDVVERIFEPFYTTKDTGRGTGLGLSMVFGFIKQSGGHISVYSEPGVGTTFRLYFPRADAAVEQAEEENKEPAPRPGAGEIVLAVEDNPGLRRIVLRQLRQLGYRSLEADGPAAALAVLEKEKVDLLFTDVVMPGGIDGIALAKQAVARWPALRVVLTSGFPGTKIDDQLGPLEGAVRLLSKPYRTSDLARLLRETLGG
jgi:PAS domain S-box-containing protein